MDSESLPANESNSGEQGFEEFLRQLTQAANLNQSILQFRRNKEFADLWSETNIAARPPVRVEFEHAIVFGTFGEAFSMRRSKSGWGKLLRLEPLHENDVLHPMRIVYQLKPSSIMRQRWEWRDTLKELLGKDRRLVGEAMRLGKKRFLETIDGSDRQVIRHRLYLDPEEFWRVVRKGERCGQNGIHRFVKELKERREGYALNFPDP